MARGLVAEIFRAYPDPRAAMARQLRAGLAEARALFHLMVACGLFFVASLPAAIRTARGIEAEEPVTAAIGAHLFGFLFLAPLLLYVASLVVHVVARAFGGRGSALAARSALFWSLLLAAPVVLALSLAGALAEIAFGVAVLPWLSVLGYAGLALWVWFFAASLAEAEQFEASGLVAAFVAGAFGLVVFVLAILAGSAAA